MVINYSRGRNINIRFLSFAATAILLVTYCSIALFLVSSGIVRLPLSLDNLTRSHAASTLIVQPEKPHCHYSSTQAWTCNFANLPNDPLSSKDWNFEVGSRTADYNEEAEAYTSRSQNVRIENGALLIEAKPEVWGGKQYTSARINTKGLFDFTYGTLSVSAMLPRGTGTWPAAWLLPAKEQYKPAAYGIAANDPLRWALNGEIDFLESIGIQPGENIPAIHSYNELHRPPTITPGYMNDPYTTYHTYGVIKKPDTIIFTIDGQPYAERVKTTSDPREWPYDQPYYLVLNLAIGGVWAGSAGIDNTSAPWQLKVNSISYQPL